MVKIKAPKTYLPALLLFIIANEMCDNFLLGLFTRFSENQETVLYFSFLFLQMIFSTVQAGLSDFYCRKKSLLISLSITALSLALSLAFFREIINPLLLMSLVMIFKGVGGNTLPMAWAGIADTQNKNVRLSLGFSTAAIGIGYLLLIVCGQWFSGVKLSLSILIIVLVALYLCYKWFIDIRDKTNQEVISLKEDLKLTYRNFIKNKRFASGLCTFACWEISFYSMHMLDVDLKIEGFRGLTLCMVCGYLIGVFFLWRLSKKTDGQLIRLGYGVSLLAFIVLFGMMFFIGERKHLIVACYSVYSLGAAFLAPSLFSIISKERAIHEQGKSYGLLDSVDTVAFALATVATTIFRLHKYNELVIIIFSSIVFFISVIPYAIFKAKKSEVNI